MESGGRAVTCFKPGGPTRSSNAFDRGTVSMTGQGSSFFRMRTRHFVIAVIAILIAVALVSNYYLW
jgi:hypothetical protein